MTTAGLTLFVLAGLLLVGGSLAWALAPLWRGALPLDPVDPRIVSLLARREATLASLRELEQDHADGRVGQETYQRLRQSLVDRGAAILAALDRLSTERAGETARLTAELEAEIEAAGGGRPLLPGGGAARAAADAAETRRCAGCDRPLAPDARFCDGCGRPVEPAEATSGRAEAGRDGGAPA